MPDLRQTLAQLPADYEVVLKPKGGSVTYTDTAAGWLEDDGKIHRLEDFELISEIHPPNGGTLASLMAKHIEPIRFVVDGLIPEGLSMLAGKPKLGKSWLALTVSLAICAGDDALGHQTKPAEVLYVSLEDGERRLQDRVRVLGGAEVSDEALARFHYRTEWPTFDRGGLDQLDTWMTEHPDTRLIVVDTYGKARGDQPGRNQYAEEYALLGRVQSFATKHRIALVLVHHLRKQGADDWLEQLSGSQAITGSADTLLGLFRDRGQMDATLRLVSREVDEKDVALKFDGGKWISMGDAFLYRQSVERTEILETLREVGKGKASDIASLVGKQSANVAKMLRAMADEGLVELKSRGVYSLNARVVSVATPLPETTETTQTTTSHVRRTNICQECGLADNRHSGMCPQQKDPW